MSCGFETTYEDFIAFVGLGTKKEEGTPSTVGLEQDNEEYDAREAAILASSKKLTYGVCLPTQCSPATANASPAKKEFQPEQFRCTPQNCRMSTGICVDCENCHKHCLCNDKGASRTRQSAGNSRFISSMEQPSKAQHHQFEGLRKTPSLMSDSSDSVGADAADFFTRKMKLKTPSPRKSPKKNKNSRRYNMGDEGEYLHLNHRTLKEHTNRSRRSDTSSHHSYNSYNSNTTSSSRRRYNMGDEDELDYSQNHHQRQPRSRRGHRRTLSGSTSGSRKSNTSFSLRLGRLKNHLNSTDHQPLANKRSNDMDDAIIGKTFSFDSNPSRGSNPSRVSAYSSDHSRRTRGSATTARRANSGSSLSSSSRSYLEGEIMEAEPKKSWLRRKLESRE